VADQLGQQGHQQNIAINGSRIAPIAGPLEPRQGQQSQRGNGIDGGGVVGGADALGLDLATQDKVEANGPGANQGQNIAEEWLGGQGGGSAGAKGGNIGKANGQTARQDQTHAQPGEAGEVFPQPEATEEGDPKGVGGNNDGGGGDRGVGQGGNPSGKVEGKAETGPDREPTQGNGIVLGFEGAPVGGQKGGDNQEAGRGHNEGEGSFGGWRGDRAGVYGAGIYGAGVYGAGVYRSGPDRRRIDRSHGKANQNGRGRNG